METTTVDHEARRIADRAEQKIDAHERHCSERWGEARKSIDATNISVRRVHERIDKVLWAVLLGLVGILAQLVMPFFKLGGG
jgi:hypothetical protein